MNNMKTQITIYKQVTYENRTVFYYLKKDDDGAEHIDEYIGEDEREAKQLIYEIDVNELAITLCNNGRFDFDYFISQVMEKGKLLLILDWNRK